MVFFMLFHVGFLSVMRGALKFLASQTTDHHEFLCVLGHGANTLSHVGLGFRVGRAGVQMVRFHGHSLS